MCGIIAILRRRSERIPPTATELTELIEPVASWLRDADVVTAAAVVEQAGERLATADRLLRGTPGVQGLLADLSLIDKLDLMLDDVAEGIVAVEGALDRGAEQCTPAELEVVSSALVRLKDEAWALQRDRLRTARAVADLAGPTAGPAAIAAFTSVQLALSAIDRLEVRGRDSAGLHLLVHGHGLDPAGPSVAGLLADRSADPLFGSESVRVADGCLSFVYKAAAEIGELGDNTQAIRSVIRRDPLLHRALVADDAECTVLGHTRWASVGIISQGNAHPLNAEEVDRPDGPYVVAALNGDVDNFADLKANSGLRIANEITTDAKVIPTLVSRRLAEGDEPAEAFRRTVGTFDGSVAIGASTAAGPDQLLLALRGSGQALYVGLSDDLYLVASEPYGVVEESDRYLRLDGETPADAANPAASRGQVVLLDGSRAGTVDGIVRRSYDGTDLPVTEDELTVPEMTTRDIDRGAYPHFLLKEITESPVSFRKTVRGKLIDRDGGLAVKLGPETLPPDVIEDLRSGAIRRVLTIGQGTAAVAASSMARALAEAAVGTDLRVETQLATELSGFALLSDLADTLVVAVSQSGTTTDTNRTVDLVRSRGGRVIAIVNRRNSDLVDKSDGVLYTSDGRDVEMSVASTKAFYAQVAAGFLLAYAIAQEMVPGEEAAAERSKVLEALRTLPEAMTATVATRPAIAAAAKQLAPAQRYWAIVGSGADRIAAMEVRIKLSELCYKSIACDATEDKKHIDLSSEPLILVCATSLRGSNVDDVAKEVAIYRAHKARPIVIATEGEERFNAALQVLTVPPVHPKLGFVLATVVGHLFGYEAALAIDAQAIPLRQARAAIEHAVSASGGGADGDALVKTLRAEFEPLTAQFLEGVRSGAYNGHLEAGSAVRLSSLFRYASGVLPLDYYQIEFGRSGSPSVLIEDLTAALTVAIDELTRPVDAIKHQAKTVTVGISRSDEGLLQVPLVSEVLAAGTARDALSYKALRTLAQLDPVVAEVTGYTRYRLDGDIAGHTATITVVDRGGIARDLPLRTERNPQLLGTKHRVAYEREVTVAVGRSDGRSVIIVPEVEGHRAMGLTLLHVRFRERLPATKMRAVLEGYRGRYSALKDAVTETEPVFRDDLLGEIGCIELLTEPVYVLAERWRSDRRDPAGR